MSGMLQEQKAANANAGEAWSRPDKARPRRADTEERFVPSQKLDIFWSRTWIRVRAQSQSQYAAQRPPWDGTLRASVLGAAAGIKKKRKKRAEFNMRRWAFILYSFKRDDWLNKGDKHLWEAAQRPLTKT